MVKESVAGATSMVGGDGPNSYTHNSVYQKEGADAATNLINEGIKDNLDFKNPNFDGLTTFKIVDLGCSTGPNTFSTVKNVIEATNLKYQTQIQNPQPLEFQVFFNDLPDNDFNTLFKSLSSYQNYFAGGVPGSFYGRLFPKSSIHFVNAFYALHWISKIPPVILESPALNKESIYCSGLGKQVSEAYLEQFKNDMNMFINCRAEEIVGGGLMAIQIVGRRDGVLTCQTPIGLTNQCLGYALRDMAKLGAMNEERVDAFNLPMYHPTREEMEEIIKRNGDFEMEKLEIIDRSMVMSSISEEDIEYIVAHTRAIYEVLLKEHFGAGENILEQIFSDFGKKIGDNLSLLSDLRHNNVDLFVLLKRKY